MRNNAELKDVLNKAIEKGNTKELQLLLAEVVLDIRELLRDILDLNQ